MDKNNLTSEQIEQLISEGNTAKGFDHKVLSFLNSHGVYLAFEKSGIRWKREMFTA